MDIRFKNFIVRNRLIKDTVMHVFQVHQSRRIVEFI